MNMTTVELIGEVVFHFIALLSAAGISQECYGQYLYSPQH